MRRSFVGAKNKSGRYTSAKPQGEDASVTRKKTAEAKKPSTVVVADSADMKGALKTIGGSRSDHWNNLLANQAVQPLLDKELRSGDCNSAPLLRGH
jgi:hypothetical protein